MNISRRRFIRYLLGGTAITGLSYSGDLWAQSVKGDTLRDETLAPLKEIAVAKKLIFGAATNHFALQKDLSYAQLFVSECDILVPSLELKWNVLRPSREVFQFGPADWMMSFAEKHGIRVRGHTLVW